MDRSRRLVAIRDALNALLALDDVTRVLVSTLLARSTPLPAVGNGNGVDHDPPAPPPPRPKAAPVRARPLKGKPAAYKGRPSLAEVAAKETALVEAIRSHPGAGTTKLAKLTLSGTSTVVGRLKRLETRRMIERMDDGWRANPPTPPSLSA